MADNIDALYEQAKKKGVLHQSMTPERFRQEVSTDTGLKSFYDYAGTHGMKLRPYNDFVQKVRGVAEQQAAPAAQPVATPSNPSVRENPAPTNEAEYQQNLQKQAEADAAAGGGRMSDEDARMLQLRMQTANNARKIGKMVDETSQPISQEQKTPVDRAAATLRQQLAPDVKKTAMANHMLDETGKDIQQLRQKNYNDWMAQADGWTSSQKAYWANSYKRSPYLDAANRVLYGAEARMNDARRQDGVSLRNIGTGLAEFAGSTGRHFLTKLESMASFGMSDLADAKLQRDVLRKLNNNNAFDNPDAVLSGEEKALYDAMVTNIAVEIARQNDTSRWAKSGQITADMIPFVEDIMLGNALFKGFGNAGREAITKAVEKNVKNKLLKWTATNVGDVALSAAESAATAAILPKTYGNMLGNSAELDMNTAGTDGTKMTFGGIQENGMGKAFANAYRDQFKELFTETGGNFKLIGRALVDNPYSQRIMKSSLGNVLQRFGKGTENTIGGRLANEVAYNGVLGEWLEELEGAIYDGDLKNFFTADTQLPMLLSFAVPAALTSSLNEAQRGYWDAKYKHAGRVLDGMLAASDVTDEEKARIMTSLYNSNMEDLSSTISDIVKEIYPEQYQAIMEGHAEKASEANRLTNALREYVSAGMVMTTLDPSLDEEQKAEAERVAVEEQARVDALMTQARAEAEEGVKRYAHQDGNIYPVHLIGKENDPSAFGNILFGTITIGERTGAGGEIFNGPTNNDIATVRMADGSVEQVPASDLRMAGEVASAEDVIRSQVERTMMADMLSRRFPIGSTVYLPSAEPDANGNMQSSKVLNITNDGVEIEVEDQNGQPNTTVIPLEIAAENFSPENIGAEPEIVEFTHEDGTALQASANDDGTFTVNMGGEDITITEEQLTALGYHRDTPAAEAAQEQQAGEQTEEQAQEQAPKYPVDEEGNPDWGQMDVQQSAQTVMDLLGNRGSATAYVDDQIKEAEKAQKQAMKQQSHSLNIAQRQAEEQQIRQIQDATAKSVQYWQNVKLRLAQIKTAEEQAAEQEQQRKMMEAREQRSQTAVGTGDGSMASRYNAAQKIDGYSGTTTLADGRELKGHYVLVPADALTPSHNPLNNFAKTEGYPVSENGESINDRDYTNDKEEQQKVIAIAQNYNGNALKNMPVVSDEGMVYNGNGRTMAGMLAAQNNTDADYTSSLLANAQQYGFSEEQIQSIPHARVAFQLDERLPYNTSSLAIFNEQETQTQSNTGKAAGYARKLTPQAISEVLAAVDGYPTIDAFYNDSKAPFDLINRLIEAGVLAQREKAEMVDGDKLSATGRERLGNILLGTVFDNDTIRLMGGDAALKATIIRALPHILENKGLKEFSLESDIKDAITLLHEVRKSKMPFDSFVRQTVMSEDGQVHTAAENYSPFQLLLAEEMSNGGVESFRNVLATYNNGAKAAMGDQLDIFGNVTGLGELQQLVLQRYGKETNEGADAGGQAGPAAQSTQSGDAEVSHTPIGNGVFGDVYDQFKGKVKEAFYFLISKGKADLLGVFHREGVGDIDLVWGDETGGLAHIISKHVGEGKSFASVDEAAREIENIILTGKKDFENGDKIVFRIGSKLVTIRKNYRENGKKIADLNWVLSAYDELAADGSNSAIKPAIQSQAAPATAKNLRKGSEKNPNTQISEEKNAEKMQISTENAQNGAQPADKEWDDAVQYGYDSIMNTVKAGRTYSAQELSNGIKEAQKTIDDIQSGKLQQDNPRAAVASLNGWIKAYNELLQQAQPAVEQDTYTIDRSKEDIYSKPNLDIMYERIKSVAGNRVVLVKFGGAEPWYSTLREDADAIKGLPGVEDYSSMNNESLVNISGKKFDKFLKAAIAKGLRFAISNGQDGKIENAGATNAVRQEKQKLEAARQEVDTNPTDAQKEAGNYKKGHVSLFGFDITLENPKGSTRSGKDADGKEWSITMNNDYGYIRGTESVDGDHIDIYLGDNTASEKVFVMDAINQKTGAFDEHKVLLGFDSADAALDAYLANYEKGWKPGTLTEVSLDEFRKWIESSHRKTKPFAEYKNVKTEGAQGTPATHGGTKVLDFEGEELQSLPYAQDKFGRVAHAYKNYNIISNMFSDMYAAKMGHVVFGPDMKRQQQLADSAREAIIPLIQSGQLTQEFIDKLTLGRSQYDNDYLKNQRQFIRDFFESESKHVTGKLPAKDGQMDLFSQAETLQTPLEKAKARSKKAAAKKPAAKPAEEKKDTFGAKNKIVSQEEADELAKQLRDLLGEESALHVVADPKQEAERRVKIMQVGSRLAMFYIEGGARKFGDYCQQMVAKLGDAIRPYLKSLYMAAKYDPAMAQYMSELDDEAGINAVDVEKIGKVEASPSTSFTVGDKVTYKGKWDATIEGVNADGTYNLSYDKMPFMPVHVMNVATKDVKMQKSGEKVAKSASNILINQNNFVSLQRELGKTTDPNFKKQLEWLLSHAVEFATDYLEKNGNVLDPDALREYFSPIGYNGTNVPEYRPLEKHFVRDMYEIMLQKAKSEGKPTVVFLTGHGGAGKSTATRNNERIQDLKQSVGLIYDSALNGKESLLRVLRIALDSGVEEKDITIIPVYNDLVTSFKNSVERGLRVGRFLGIKYLVEDAFKKNAGKMKAIHDSYPEISIIPIDNSNNNGGREVTIDEAIGWDYSVSEETLTNLLEAYDTFKQRGLRSDQIAAIEDGLSEVEGIRLGESREGHAEQIGGGVPDNAGGREVREDELRVQRTVETIGTVKKSKDTRDGSDIWLVNPEERVSTEEFKVLKARAKANNGHWSSFKANRGFLFRTEEDANNFNTIQEYEQTDEQTAANSQTIADQGTIIAGEAETFVDGTTTPGTESAAVEDDPHHPDVDAMGEVFSVLPGETFESAADRNGIQLLDVDINQVKVEADGHIRRIDEQLEQVNHQLALLGYYAADSDVDSQFNEIYGYGKTAEKKAVKDADRLAKQLAADLGIEVSKRKTIAQANIAPAGGDITFKLPLKDETFLYVDISMEWNFGYHRGTVGREDDLYVGGRHGHDGAMGIMFRVEDPNASSHYSRYRTSNTYADADITYQDLLQQIKRTCREFLPEVVANNATTTEKQPLMTPLERAQKNAADNEAKKESRKKTNKVQDNATMGDLFADVVDEIETINNSNTDDNGESDIRREPGSSRNESGNNDGGEHNVGLREETDGDNAGAGQDAGSSNRGGSRSSNVPTRTKSSRVRLEEKPLAESERKNTRNNRSERGVDYAPKGEKARFDANVAAITLLKELEEKGEQATPEQMQVLRQFSGWGGLGQYFKENDYTTSRDAYKLKQLLTDEEYDAANLSRNSAYFTPAAIIDRMWDIAHALGFRGGNVLEGSAGIGDIIGHMPQDMSDRSDIQAVEIDPITGGILKQLYPDAKVTIDGFQNVNIPNGSQDLVITNVPFVTGLRVYDKVEKDLSKRFGNIHDFCIAKNVRKLREGGLGVFITTSGTMDKSKELRKWLVNEGNADIIGAFRLNNKTFGGTTATSDIIVVRKRVNGKTSRAAQRALDTIKVRDVEVPVSEAYDRKKRDFVQVTERAILDYNQYFVEHPEHMGGEMGFGFEHGDTRYGGTTQGLYPTMDIDQEKRLQAFVERMADIDMDSEYRADNLNEVGKQILAKEGASTYEEDKGTHREGEMHLNSKGEICVRRSGMSVPVAVNAQKVKGATKAQCLTDYQAIKDALAEVLKAQTEHNDDAALAPALKQLNKVYDAFTKKYGNFYKNTAISFLRTDIDFPSIQALAEYTEKETLNGKKSVEVKKSDVFSKRVVGVRPEAKPETTKDAAVLSIQKYGRLDLGMMAEWLNKSEQDVRDGLLTDRLAFEDPISKEVVVRHQYLSGNVREKLEFAQNENKDGQYDANVEELQKVIPPTIPAHMIEFSLGSTWIEPQLYMDFVKDTYDVDLKIMHIGGVWADNKPSEWQLSKEKNKAAGVYSDMCRKQIYGTDLLMAAMNNVPVVVQTTRTTGYGSDKHTETITDKDASQVCSTRIDEIKDEFREWCKNKMMADTELSDRMEKTYNDRFNAIVPMRVDELFLEKHLPGQNHEFEMRPHQQQAIVKGTMQPLMIAHGVGTGKTFTLISTAMEMRRLGTAKKPMIVVQNATTAQFVGDAKRLYPNSKVLVVSEQDRTAQGRQEFYAKIKYNDWDLIIIPQSVFDMIPDSDERKRDFIREKIDEKQRAYEMAKEAGANSQILKNMEKEIERLNEDMMDANVTGKRSSKKKNEDEDLKKKAERAASTAAKAEEMLDRRTDDIEDFDSMGIDALLIDEAHNYKHLGFATMMQRGVKGVDPSYSKKAAGLYLKCQSVFERCGHKNVVFATGTPISNTAAEVWTFMKYLLPKHVMEDNEIYYFDDFVRNFGRISQSLEFGASGKFKETTRFASYNNMPELARIWGQVSDTVLSDEAKDETGKSLKESKEPEMEGGKATDIFLEQSNSMVDIMRSVRSELEAFEKMSGKEKKEKSYIPLVMFGIASRAAIDPRLVDGNAVDEPESKTNKTVEETLRALKDSKKYNGTVAIFCDKYRRLEVDENGKKKEAFNIFKEIKRKLIEKGVPEDQIVIMESGMADTKKQRIFDDMNAGNKRVIIGTTQTLGTGVNIQERLFALIHMDAPDRPMDMTQREGRILRQGNLHKQWGIPVRVIRMGVKDSLDVTGYQRLQTKAKFIDAVMRSKYLLNNNLEGRVLEEEEEGVFDNPVAVLSGSQYAMLKSQAEREYRKWAGKLSQYNADQIYIENKTRDNKARVQYYEQVKKECTAQLALLDRVLHGEKPKTIVFDGKECKTEQELNAAIKEWNKGLQQRIANMKADTWGPDHKSESVSVSFDGIPFTIDIDLRRISGYDYKEQRSKNDVRKEVRYSSDAMSIANFKSNSVDMGNTIQSIIEDVMSGREARERIKLADSNMERIAQDNAEMDKRRGKAFEFSKELADAKAKVDEYTKLMKEELDEKEKKYADKGNGKTVDVSEATTDDVEETDAEAQYSTELDELRDSTEGKDITVELLKMAIEDAGINFEVVEDEEVIPTADNTEFSIRQEAAPKKTGIGYKVFYRGKDGKLYPPMVANPNGADTPVGVWLNADAAPLAGVSKTGRPQVKAGGKGTQGGSGSLAYRPGWHLGEIPYALQFNRMDENGNKTLFPKDFVWAEVEYAADVDYQKDAEAEGMNANGKFQHSLAGLKRVPENGYYRYRTNPNPATDPWIITGAMKVNRVLNNDEVDDIVRKAGREPQLREMSIVGGNDIFVSNAAAALGRIKQEKATPEQWLAMLTKEGGIKAGEDKWMGLSDWLRQSEAKTLTKGEVMQFVRDNAIQIEEVKYGEKDESQRRHATISDMIEDDYTSENLTEGYGLPDGSKAYRIYTDAAGELYEPLEWMAIETPDGKWFVGDGDRNTEVASKEAAFEALCSMLGLNSRPTQNNTNSSMDTSWSRPINAIRLQYTTFGLKNNREIALTVPNIENWQQDDNVHFGDAGNGRAVTWVRFGDTIAYPGASQQEVNRYNQSLRAIKQGTDTGVAHDIVTEFTEKYGNGERVLVIDEIQSKRHQEGREKGYKKNLDKAKAESEFNTFYWGLRDKYGEEWNEKWTKEEQEELQRLDKARVTPWMIARNEKLTPDAPFDKNWPELAFKRMLRLAAEEGYDRVAWTTGKQQADRYGLRGVVDEITVSNEGYDYYLQEWDEVKLRSVNISLKNENHIKFDINGEGQIISSLAGQYDGKTLADVVGKEMAEKILSVRDEDFETTFRGGDLEIGGEGMKAFYDQMLPSFVKKYVKKWGATVEDVALPNVEKAGRVMHSVTITPEMRESVMQGQTQFLYGRSGKMMGYADANGIHVTKAGLNPNTMIHEYTHLWARAMEQKNREGWESIKSIFRGTPYWDEVLNDANYRNIRGDEDRVCSEVIARYSGRRGAERLSEVEDELKYEAEQSGSVLNKAKLRQMMRDVRNAITKFWKWVGTELFHIKHFESAEDVADRVLFDLLTGTDINTDSEVTSMFPEMAFDPERQKAIVEWTKKNPAPVYKIGESFDAYMLRLKEYKKRREEFIRSLDKPEPPTPSTPEPPTTPKTPLERAKEREAMKNLLRDDALVAEYVAFINDQADAGRKIKKEHLMRGLIDAAKPIEDFQDWLIRHGAKIDDESNAYTDTFLATGRVSNESERLNRDFIRPLAKQIAKLTGKDSPLNDIELTWHNMDTEGIKEKKDGKRLTAREIIGIYCQAKDCEEAEIKGLPDRGAAGFVNNLGTPYMDIIKEVESRVDMSELNTLWDMIRKCTKFALEYDYQSGRISEDTFKEFSDREYYVPQRGWRERDESGLVTEYAPVGRRGDDPYNAALVKARGRKSLAADPFAYIMSIDNSSIVSSEHNKIKQKFLKLCLDNEDLGLQTGAFRVKKYWIVNVMGEDGKVMKDADGNNMVTVTYAQPDEKVFAHDKEVKKEINKVRAELGKVQRMFEKQNEHGELSPTLKAAYNRRIEQLEKKIEELEDTMQIAWTMSNSQITQRTSDEKKQHEVRVLLNGEQYVIELQDEKLANAINQKFKQHQEALFDTTQRMRNYTRFMSAMLTQYNPEFAASNFVRDYQVALATLAAEHKELLPAFTKHFAKAQKAVWTYAWNDKVKENERFTEDMYGKYLKEYFRSGAPTGFSYMKDLNVLRDDFQRMIKDNNLRRGMRAAVGVFSMLTEVSETSTRFAGYVAARESGMGVNEAAYLSKELTTNFDRAGEVADSGWMSWFSFFRATLNGNIKFLKALKKMPLAYSLIAASYFAFGMLNQFLNPDDPEDEVLASDYMRESNFVIGKWRIPTAHFLRMFFAAGVNAGMWMQGSKGFGETVYNTATFATNEMLPNYLNVLGNATEWDRNNDRMEFTFAGLIQGFAPSAALPLVDVAVNRDFKGSTINREPFTKAQADTKDILLAKDHTLPIYDAIVKGVYETVGGDLSTKRKSDDPAWRSWLFDTSASSLEHVVEGYVPAGVDMLATVANAIYDGATGTPTGPDKWPFVRKFYNAYTPQRAYNQQYYMLNGRVKTFKDKLDDYKANSPKKYNLLTHSEEYKRYQKAQTLVKKQKENPTRADIEKLMEANKEWFK